ncbi:hypothetical protein NL676_010701 [Syzygium grande]|nr:hypothetical protein NL676_010701 [Syzygium grande]
MEGGTPSADQNVPRDDKEPRVSSALCESECNAEVPPVSMDRVLPDDLLEQILARLPFADIVRAGATCTWWRGIITSETFQKKLLHGVLQRPWILRPPAYAYDPVYNLWYKLERPGFKSYYRSVKFASSTGLISVFEVDECGIPRLCVGNPLTRRWREIAQPPPSVKYVHRTTLAISASRTTLSYRISIVTINDLPGVQVGPELWIHLYNSKTRMWKTCMTEVSRGWKSGDESAICDGVLYFLIYSGDHVSPAVRCSLVMYDLSRQCSNEPLASLDLVSCPLAGGRLLNMREKLVLVGGIDKGDGVGIWVLNGREWHEIAHMPDDIFLGFRPYTWLDSYGSNDLIYFLRGYDPSHIVTFDMNQKQWSRNSFAKFPYEGWPGFCFEPQLEIVP